MCLPLISVGNMGNHPEFSHEMFFFMIFLFDIFYPMFTFVGRYLPLGPSNSFDFGIARPVILYQLQLVVKLSDQVKLTTILKTWKKIFNLSVKNHLSFSFNAWVLIFSIKLAFWSVFSWEPDLDIRDGFRTSFLLHSNNE